MSYAEKLISLRPKAAAYAESLRQTSQLDAAGIAHVRGFIRDLVIYPVKSLGGLHVNVAAR